MNQVGGSKTIGAVFDTWRGNSKSHAILHREELCVNSRKSEGLSPKFWGCDARLDTCPRNPPHNQVSEETAQGPRVQRQGRHFNANRPAGQAGDSLRCTQVRCPEKPGFSHRAIKKRRRAALLVSFCFGFLLWKGKGMEWVCRRNRRWMARSERQPRGGSRRTVSA